MKRSLIYALPFIACCIILVVGCRNQTGKKESQPETSVVSKSAFESAETYSGIIPCADCAGILMVLKISKDYQNFELSRTYQGKGDETFVVTGKMNTERGFEDDSNATVFLLNWDQAEKDQSYFVRYSNDNSKIYMLSRDKKRIDSNLNYTLDKQ